MMNGQINDLLANIISMYAPQFGRTITKKVALNLAMTAIECQIRIRPAILMR